MNKRQPFQPADPFQKTRITREFTVAFAGCGAISALHLAGVIAQPR